MKNWLMVLPLLATTAQAGVICRADCYAVDLEGKMAVYLGMTGTRVQTGWVTAFDRTLEACQAKFDEALKAKRVDSKMSPMLVKELKIRDEIVRDRAFRGQFEQVPIALEIVHALPGEVCPLVGSEDASSASKDIGG